jgi:hypothetical protein
MKKGIKLLILLALSFNYVFSQECNYQSDTVILVYITGKLTNERPFTTIGVLKAENKYNINKNMLSEDSSICNLYKHAIFLPEPFLTVNDNIDCIKDKSPKKYTKSYLKKLKKLNKSFESIYKSDDLSVQITKVYADFWVTEKLDKINSSSNSYKMPMSCYSYDYYYKLKELKKILTPLQEDKKVVLEMLMLE